MADRNGVEVVVQNNGDGVEAAGWITQPFLGEVDGGHLQDLGDFAGIDHFFGSAELVADLGFDLDKNIGIFISGNDVDLTKTGAVVADDNFQTKIFQELGGQIFPDLAGFPVIYFTHYS